MLLCCFPLFGPSLWLFLSFVKIWIFLSPGFYLLVVSICVCPSVPFFCSLYFSGFSFFHLFTLSLDFSALLGIIKLVEVRFEWLSLDNEFLYPLITIWFKTNSFCGIFKLQKIQKRSAKWKRKGSAQKLQVS